MLWIIVLLVLKCIAAFLVDCCFDKVDLCNPSLNMPSIQNIDENSYRTIERYVERVISPAYYYFELRKDLNEKQEFDFGSILISNIAVRSFFTILIIKQEILIELQIPNALMIVITLSISIVINFIVDCIHKKSRFKLGKWDDSFGEIKERVKDLYDRGYESDYGIDIEVETNNAGIFTHLKFLEEVKEKIYLRYYSRKIIEFITVIYIFLFYGLFKFL